jgi:hypothetical protein
VNCDVCNDTGLIETYTQTIEYGLVVFDGEAPCPVCCPDEEVPM